MVDNNEYLNNLLERFHTLLAILDTIFKYIYLKREHVRKNYDLLDVIYKLENYTDYEFTKNDMIGIVKQCVYSNNKNKCYLLCNKYSLDVPNIYKTLIRYMDDDCISIILNSITSYLVNDYTTLRDIIISYPFSENHIKLVLKHMNKGREFDYYFSSIANDIQNLQCLDNILKFSLFDEHNDVSKSVLETIMKNNIVPTTETLNYLIHYTYSNTYLHMDIKTKLIKYFLNFDLTLTKEQLDGICSQFPELSVVKKFVSKNIVPDCKTLELICCNYNYYYTIEYVLDLNVKPSINCVINILSNLFDGDDDIILMVLKQLLPKIDIQTVDDKSINSILTKVYAHGNYEIYYYVINFLGIYPTSDNLTNVLLHNNDIKIVVDILNHKIKITEDNLDALFRTDKFNKVTIVRILLNYGLIDNLYLIKKIYKQSIYLDEISTRFNIKYDEEYYDIFHKNSTFPNNFEENCTIDKDIIKLRFMFKNINPYTNDHIRDILQYMVDSGAKLDRYCLDFACCSNNYYLVEYFVDKGCKLNSKILHNIISKYDSSNLMNNILKMNEQLNNTTYKNMSKTYDHIDPKELIKEFA